MFENNSSVGDTKWHINQCNECISTFTCKHSGVWFGFSCGFSSFRGKVAAELWSWWAVK